MKDSSKKEDGMAKALSSGLMVTNTLAIGTWARGAGEELWNSQMAISMTGSGKTVIIMDKVCTLGQMA